MTIQSQSCEAQRQRLLEALRLRPLSTPEIRRSLDIPAPAPRIFELRKTGYDIARQWIRTTGESGELHRFALYHLVVPEVKHA